MLVYGRVGLEPAIKCLLPDCQSSVRRIVLLRWRQIRVVFSIERYTEDRQGYILVHWLGSPNPWCKVVRIIRHVDRALHTDVPSVLGLSF